MALNLDDLTFLSANVNKLPPKDINFGTSLLKQHVSGKMLSASQSKWITKLAEKIKNEGKPRDELQFDVGDYSAVMALFDKAKASYPRLKLQTDAGVPVVFARATKGKHIGKINVSDGGPYSDNKWYGRIDKNGTWTAGEDLSGSAVDAIADVIYAFGEDPVKAITQYGLMTGHCSICSLPLTDPRSIKTGVGPVCAKNFGIPWGE